MGRGLVLRGQPRPVLRGGAPALPNFGVPLCLCPHPLTQNDHVGKVTRGKGCFLVSVTPPIPSWWRSSDPQFWGSRLFMSRPFDVERPNSALQHTWGGVCTCFRGQATPLHIAQKRRAVCQLSFISFWR